MNLSLFERARCRICNHVASGEIASETGDFTSHTFILEADGLGFVCSECEGHVKDVKTDYDIEDQVTLDEQTDLDFMALEELYG